jgi:lipopolysaccharide transport system permease protein
MQRFSAVPGEMFACAWRHRSLLRQLVVREVSARYRGSLIGLLWSFLNPALMLAVYTFVFGVVVPAKWPQGEQLTTTDFSIILFTALIVHSFFADCVIRAPGLIVSNQNLVKKVVFPLELLPWTAVGAALFQALVSILVLLIAMVVLSRYVAWTVVFLPFVLLPLLLMAVGFSWFLAGLGVYVRDIGQAMGIVSTALLFISPAFFPIEQIPSSLQLLVRLNPLTVPINQARQVVIWGVVPDWTLLGAWMLASLVIAWVGFWWFQRTRPGFADVL